MLTLKNQIKLDIAAELTWLSENTVDHIILGLLYQAH